MIEDEMVGQHHQLNGHEFVHALGVVDGQGSLACYSPWGCKESDTTELNSMTCFTYNLPCSLKSHIWIYNFWINLVCHDSSLNRGNFLYLPSPPISNKVLICKFHITLFLRAASSKTTVKVYQQLSFTSCMFLPSLTDLFSGIFTDQRRQWQPTPVLLPGKSHGWRSSFPVCSVVKSLPANAGDALLIPGLGRSLGAGNGNPPQQSCQEIPQTKEPCGIQSMVLQRVGNS